jgi:hypothetical protein
MCVCMFTLIGARREKVLEAAVVAIAGKTICKREEKNLESLRTRKMEGKQ